MSSCERGLSLDKCSAWPRVLCRLRAQELLGSACCAVVGSVCRGNRDWKHEGPGGPHVETGVVTGRFESPTPPQCIEWTQGSPDEPTVKLTCLVVRVAGLKTLWTASVGCLEAGSVPKSTESRDENDGKFWMGVGRERSKVLPCLAVMFCVAKKCGHCTRTGQVNQL